MTLRTPVLGNWCELMHPVCVVWRGMNHVSILWKAKYEPKGKPRLLHKINQTATFPNNVRWLLKIPSVSPSPPTPLHKLSSIFDFMFQTPRALKDVESNEKKDNINLIRREQWVNSNLESEGSKLCCNQRHGQTAGPVVQFSNIGAESADSVFVTENLRSPFWKYFDRKRCCFVFPPRRSSHLVCRVWLVVQVCLDVRKLSIVHS